MGEIHELFVLAIFLVWFAGATPETSLPNFWVFPFFPKDFRGSPGKKNPCFFARFPCFFSLSEKARKGRSGALLGTAAQAPWTPPSNPPRPPLLRGRFGLDSTSIRHWFDLRKPPPATEPFRDLRARNPKRVKKESPGPSGPGGPKSPKRVKNESKWPFFDSFLTLFGLSGLSGPPGPEGLGDSFLTLLAFRARSARNGSVAGGGFLKIRHRFPDFTLFRCRIDAESMPKSTPEEGRSRRIGGWGPGGLCLINPSQAYGLSINPRWGGDVETVVARIIAPEDLPSSSKW